MKMEQIECSETSAYIIQTPGKYPKENTICSEHGEVWNQEPSYTVYFNTCFIIVLSSSVVSFVSCCTKHRYSFWTPATFPTNHTVLRCNRLIFSDECTSRRLWLLVSGASIALVSRDSNYEVQNPQSFFEYIQLSFILFNIFCAHNIYIYIFQYKVFSLLPIS